MTEIEKIQHLAEMTKDEELSARILAAIDVFSDTFERQMQAAGLFMLEGDNTGRPDPEAAGQALRLLHDVGVEYGIEFPYPDSEQTIGLYVIQFGKEIIFRGRANRG